ncbi:MAG TPA: nucleotidyltransferase domain-containing protein [Chloroflexota bacterium]|nr:nucleotidyltransferase domain-containing protein [Chloroflexota bacterium]
MPPATPTDPAERLARRGAEHDALLERVRALLESDDRVAAAWLFGSRGRGDADALSDVDLVVVAHEEHLEALKRERRDIVARLGAPLLIQDLPSNAPPGGAYLLVLYPGETGPLHMDWYWRGLSGAVVPHDACLLIRRSGVTVPREPLSAAATATEEAIDIARSVIFFWAMAPIAAKYLARQCPAEAFDLLRMLTNALDRVRQAAECDAEYRANNQPGERWRGMLTVDLREQSRTLRHLCTEMEALLPRIGPLHPIAGHVTPETPQYVLRFIDLVESLIMCDRRASDTASGVVRER